GLRVKSVSVRQRQFEECSIVVAVTVANGRGEGGRLAVCTKRTINGIARKSPAKIPEVSARCSVARHAAPSIERVGDAHVADVVCYERGGTVCGATHASAIAWIQRTFKEWLGRQRVEIGQIRRVRAATLQCGCRHVCA